MNTEFWLENWKNNKIGFHQQITNPYLTAFWQQLAVVPNSQVFVPLCGKSLDLLWLYQQGYFVIGVEISDIAVSQFFSEHGLPYTTLQQDGFYQHKSDRLNLLQGDFFNLTSKHLHNVAAVFDRASLVALPIDLRQKYAQHLKNILPDEAKMLLVTFEYESSQLDGPPFSVVESEVNALYENSYEIKLLLAQDVLNHYPQFRTLGLNKLTEKVYLLQPR